MGERKQGIRWATDTFGHISHLTLVQCLALLESDAKFDASFLLHILYIRICWETWELKAACSCLKPKKNDFIQFHSSAKWMLHDTCDSEAGWTFHWLNIASPFPSRFRAFHEFIWSIINSMTPYDQWIQKQLWSWPRLQALISSASCIRTTSERMPRCFCLKTRVSLSFSLGTNTSSHENASKQRRELGDISRLCSLLSKSNHSNEVCTMSNIILNYMIVNDHLFMMLENLGSCNVQKIGCRGMSDTISSWNIPLS